jgi:hypothetical protein
MSTARTIRRFTDEPVDDATLARCLEAATRAQRQAWSGPSPPARGGRQPRPLGPAIPSAREEVTVRLECAPVPGMGWMFLADPDGNWIELFGAL